MNHTKIIINFNILNPLSKENRETITPMHKKLCCLNDRAKRMQDLRVVDKYFLIKLVTWTRKQDLRVVDKYFLIKLVTWTRDEIVYTYQSRSENKSNYYYYFFAFIIRALKKWECGTRDGGRVEGEGRGGGRGATRCVTYVRSPVKLVGRIRLELALQCARLQASFIHPRIGPWTRPTPCFSSLNRAMDKIHRQNKDGRLLPLLTLAGLVRPAEREVPASILATGPTIRFLN